MPRRKSLIRYQIGGRDGKHHATLLDVVDWPHSKNVLLSELTVKTRKGKARIVDEVPPISFTPGEVGRNAIKEYLDDGAGHFLTADITPAQDDGARSPYKEMIVDDDTNKTAQSAIAAGSLTHEQAVVHPAGGWGINLGLSSVDTTLTGMVVGYLGPLIAGSTHAEYRMGVSINAVAVPRFVNKCQLKLTRISAIDTLTPNNLVYVVLWRGAAYFGAAITTADIIDDTVIAGIHDGKQADYVALGFLTKQNILDAGTGDLAVVFDLDMNKVDRNLLVNRAGNTDLLIVPSLSATPSSISALSGLGDPDNFVGMEESFMFASQNHATTSKRPVLLPTSLD